LQAATHSPLGDTPLGAWALVPANRDILSTRLELRFDEMMRLGFLDEVRGLQARGDLTPAHPAVRAVGYRQLWEHLEGQFSLPEAVRRGITATRQLSKRQMTWIRSEPGLTWVDPFVPGGCERWSTMVAEWLRPLGR
jgi:tRNA dimethylallyltransferase